MYTRYYVIKLNKVNIESNLTSCVLRVMENLVA